MPPLAPSAILCLGSMLLLFIAIAVTAGHVQDVSFERLSTFFVPLIVLFGIALCGWATGHAFGPWYGRWLRLALPSVVLLGTLILWHGIDDWPKRLSHVTSNSLRFLGGNYSLATAYSRQDDFITYGIDPAALEAWRHVPPGAAIWSTNVGAYCMAPGCWIESVVSFLESPRLDELLTAPPAQEKTLLQQAGLDYFLVSDGRSMIDILPYSPLFAPDTIGRYLGVKWTDGSTFLLTWIGPDTTSIGPEFQKVYRGLLAQPEQNWFRFSALVPQIRAAVAGLRAKPWGEAANFPWRHPTR